jgi:aminoglycoside phosphotransferase (APT) family kinase protein
MRAEETRNDGGGYGAVRSELPLDRLEPYLREHVAGFKGPIEVKQFNVRQRSLAPVRLWENNHETRHNTSDEQFGQSNPTYLLISPSHRLVLRRQPSGALLSPTAHRIDREYLILDAINTYNRTLSDQDTDRKIPVPKVYCLCMDKDVVGAGFYVMEFLEGRIFTDVRMPASNPEERRAL